MAGWPPAPGTASRRHKRRLTRESGPSRRGQQADAPRPRQWSAAGARPPTRHNDLDDEHGFEVPDQVPGLNEQIVAGLQAQAQHERERMEIEEADAASFDEHCEAAVNELFDEGGVGDVQGPGGHG